MEKIIVNPRKVRGLGNIIPQKSPSDFTLAKCELTETTVTIEDEDMTMFQMDNTVHKTIALTMAKTTFEYAERVILEAHVENTEGRALAGEVVKFYNENDYLFATKTTDSNGDISTTIYSYLPGQHSFTAILESAPSVSDTINVVVNAPQLTVSAGSTETTAGQSVPVTYSLKDSNGNPIANERIIVYECQNGQSCEGVAKTVGNDGTYTHDLSMLSPGSYEVHCTDRNGNTTSNIETILWITSANAVSLTKTGGKDILSRYDISDGTEYCTFTVQLLDGESVVRESGVTVEIYKSNSLWKSVRTDANGQANVTYSTAGAGEVSFQAKVRDFSSETYTIHDYGYYSLPSTDKSSSFTTILVEGGTNPTMAFNTDHYTVTHGSKTAVKRFPISLPTNCVISAKIQRASSPATMGIAITRNTDASLFAVNTSNGRLSDYIYANGSYQSASYVSCSESLSAYTELTIEKRGLIVTIKVNGTTYMTKTLPYSSSNTLYAGIGVANTSVANVKEIIIKPL